MKLKTIARTGIRLLRVPRYKEWHASLSLKPGLRSHPNMTDIESAAAAGEWLVQSQTIQKPQPSGYAVGYSLFTGWHRPFPETTGYIIPTLLDLGKRLKREEFITSALVAGEWLLTQQLEDGSFPDMDGTPRIFDTGQIIFGLLAIHARTKETAYLDAARRAGDWIVQQQTPEGSWTNHTYQGTARTYYTRASWALLELATATSHNTYREAAKKQLAWTLEQQDSDGWFRNVSFFEDNTPVLHTIAYTIEGLLQCGRILGDERLIAAGTLAAKKLLDRLERDKHLASHYTTHWVPVGAERCPTGMAQAGIIFTMIKDPRCAKAVKLLKEELKGYQGQGSRNMRGALPGSVPVLGSYMRATYPNWAAKFLIDLMVNV